MLVLLGLVRAVALLRRGTGASWRDALGAFFIWQSTSLVVARASVLACSPARPRSCARRRPARRRSGGRRCGRTGPSRRWPCSACSGIAGALTKATELAGPLLAGLLLFPTLGMAAAPFNSWAAQRAALPPDLVEVRTMEWKRSQRRQTFVRSAALGGLVTVSGVVIAALSLLLPGRTHVQTAEPGRADHEADRVADPEPDPVAHAEPHTVAHA